MSKRITAEEIASELEVSLGHVYRMLRSGIIPSIRAGRIYIVSRSAFNRWLDNGGMPIPAASTGAESRVLQ